MRLYTLHYMLQLKRIYVFILNYVYLCLPNPKKNTCMYALDTYAAIHIINNLLSK